MTEPAALHDALWKHYKADRDRKEIELVAMSSEVARLTAANADLTAKLTAAPPVSEPPNPKKKER